ncbi:asparaginase [Virgibacillus sp. W0430]|uniref:asparaginase n=1 Tax=Virgibacillus sp. W0430 TaxID=3391580 RepID=UPI003F466588
MKRIAIIEMGGTISAQGKDRLDLKDYQSGIYTGQDYLSTVPELGNLAQIHFEAFANVSSTAVDSSMWIKLRKRILHYINKENFDGIVITHGTNTIEETAFFLHLTVPTAKPIVLVGSQRPFSALSSDAHLNLYNAVKVATNENSYKKGVLVVLNDEINCAREATKTNTYRLEAFQSGASGYLGYIDPDRSVQYYRSPQRRHTINSEFSTMSFASLPNVEIIYSYAGATGHLINYIAQSGKFKGIVTAGTGAGLVSPLEKEALLNAVSEGITIVRSSRTGNGRVVNIDSYTNPPIISGDNLLPQKARILLMLALHAAYTPAKIQRVFNEY